MYLNEITSNIFATFVSLIEDYGWYILLFGIVFIYAYHRVLKYHINEFKKQRDEQEYAAKYHKNPDLFVARQIAQQEVAMKLQEKYRRDAEEYKKKLEQREAQKRDDTMAKLQGKGGQKLGSNNNQGGSSSSSNQSNSFKPGYNPLMGSSGGSTYRAPKRSACSRGGCG